MAASVTLLAVDPLSGWLAVLGPTPEGTVASTWIISRYVEPASEPAQPPGSGLAWCPPRHSLPHPSGRLRLATWNLETLHAHDGQSVYTGIRR